MRRESHFDESAPGPGDSVRIRTVIVRQRTMRAQAIDTGASAAKVSIAETVIQTAAPRTDLKLVIEILRSVFA